MADKLVRGNSADGAVRVFAAAYTRHVPRRNRGTRQTAYGSGYYGRSGT